MRPPAKMNENQNPVPVFKEGFRDGSDWKTSVSATSIEALRGEGSSSGWNPKCGMQVVWRVSGRELECWIC